MTNMKVFPTLTKSIEKHAKIGYNINILGFYDQITRIRGIP